MSENTERLSTAIADRYRIERHLGQGGMASSRDSSRDSADVTEVTSGRLVALATTSRAAASAATYGAVQDVDPS